MNNDLISRSALLELYADTDEIKFDVYNVPVPVVRQNILDMPTIDAEPVRHGRWEEESQNSAYYGKLVSCSECGAFLDPKKVKAYRFCYNCGAKMDGDSHD